MVPFLNIPILSVVLMLLAGILIGHLIWYRDRSDDEAALVGLRGENDDLQTALDDHKQAYVEVESELDGQRREWDRLKVTNKQLEQSRQETDHQRALLSAELARLQQLKDQAFHDLDQERQQRRSLQKALTQAEEHTVQIGAASEQLQQQVATFHVERDDLDQAAQAKLQQQDATVEQLTIECDAARQEVAEHQDLLARVQAELQAREEDLRLLREERDELSVQIEDHRTSHEQVQQRMSQVDQLVNLRDEALSRAASTEEENGRLQEQLTSHQQTNERLKQEHYELVASHASLQREFMAQKEEHEAVASMLIDERSRLSEMEAEITRNAVASSERDEAKRREQVCNEFIAKLQSEAHERQNDFDFLRRDLEETAAQLGNERRQREHQQNVLVERDAEIESLSQSHVKLQSLHQKLEAAHLSAARQRETAQSLAAQLQKEIANERQAFSELQASADTISTQNRKLREQAEILMALRGEHESVKRMLEDKSRELDDVLKEHEASLVASIQLASTINALQQNVELLQSAHTKQDCELLNLRSKVADHAETQRSLEEQSERLDKVLAQRDEALKSQAALDASERQLRTEVSSQCHAFGLLSQQHQQAQQELTIETERHAETAATLKQQTDRVERLQKDLRQQESWHQKHMKLQTRFEEDGERSRLLTAERDAYLEESKSAESLVKQLESKSRASKETIRQLRRERRAILTRVSKPTAVPFTRPATQSFSTKTDLGRMRRDEVLGMVYTQPPKRKDDLKRISGIAQVLERKLNAFGVYTYRQVMEWDTVAVNEFSKLLSFRDRIQRDDWIGQARNLQHEHYHRAA